MNNLPAGSCRMIIGFIFLFLTDAWIGLGVVGILFMLWGLAALHTERPDLVYKDWKWFD